MFPDLPLAPVIKAAIDKAEEAHIRKVMVLVNFNQRKAAELLDISYRNMNMKSKKYGLRKSDTFFARQKEIHSAKPETPLGEITIEATYGFDSE